MEKPSVRCELGNLSATRALNGSIAILKEASIIMSIPAPTHKAGIKAANNPALGIRMSPKLASTAPAKKYGRLRPKRVHVLSL